MLITNPRKKIRGFTLTEMAIVLSSIAVLIGAIWVAGDKVWNNYNATRTAEEVQEIAGLIRSQYANVQTPPPWTAVGVNNDVNIILDLLNLFPSRLRRDISLILGAPLERIDHVLYDGLDPTARNYGSLHVYYINAVGTGGAGGNTNVVPSTAPCGKITCFRIWLYGLDTSACSKLLMALPITDQQEGIVNVGVTNTSGSCTSNSCVTGYPVTTITSSSAGAWCNGTNEDNTVFWDFKLQNG